MSHPPQGSKAPPPPEPPPMKQISGRLVAVVLGVLGVIGLVLAVCAMGIAVWIMQAEPSSSPTTPNETTDPKLYGYRTAILPTSFDGWISETPAVTPAQTAEDLERLLAAI